VCLCVCVYYCRTYDKAVFITVVFITAVPITKLFAGGGGGTRSNVCVFITAGPSTKLFTWIERDFFVFFGAKY
jgi:hypothetical protein